MYVVRSFLLSLFLYFFTFMYILLYGCLVFVSFVFLYLFS